MRRILPAFSYIFHPLFISVYATLFYFVVTKNFFYEHEIYLAFLQVLILTVLLPVSMYYLLRSLGLIKTKMLLDKGERKLPLAFQALLLVILIKHSFSILVIPELFYYFLGYLISTLLMLILALFRFKASLHMMGISALTVFTISISAYYHIYLLNLIAFFIVCMGFTASSRLLSEEHTMKDIVLGSLLGIVPQAALWFIWLMPAL